MTEEPRPKEKPDIKEAEQDPDLDLTTVADLDVDQQGADALKGGCTGGYSIPRAD
jgi:hypothetical protein